MSNFNLLTDPNATNTKKIQLLIGKVTPLTYPKLELTEKAMDFITKMCQKSYGPVLEDETKDLLGLSYSNNTESLKKNLENGETLAENSKLIEEIHRLSITDYIDIKIEPLLSPEIKKDATKIYKMSQDLMHLVDSCSPKKQHITNELVCLDIIFINMQKKHTQHCIVNIRKKHMNQIVEYRKRRLLEMYLHQQLHYLDQQTLGFEVPKNTLTFNQVELLARMLLMTEIQFKNDSKIMRIISMEAHKMVYGDIILENPIIRLPRVCGRSVESKKINYQLKDPTREQKRKRIDEILNALSETMCLKKKANITISPKFKSMPPELESMKAPTIIFDDEPFELSKAKSFLDEFTSLQGADFGTHLHTTPRILNTEHPKIVLPNILLDPMLQTFVFRHKALSQEEIKFLRQEPEDIGMKCLPAIIITIPKTIEPLIPHKPKYYSTADNSPKFKRFTLSNPSVNHENPDKRILVAKITESMRNHLIMGLQSANDLVELIKKKYAGNSEEILNEAIIESVRKLNPECVLLESLHWRLCPPTMISATEPNAAK